MSSDLALPQCPNGLFNFPSDSVLVEDPDEEILELYMNLASTGENDIPNTGGLGFLDSSSQILELEILLSPHVPVVDIATDAYDATYDGRKRRAGKKSDKAKEVRIDVKVQQDLMALKGRKGDTGSVLWRSSLFLARHLLGQHHFPPLSPLFNREPLRECRILELGAGTGLLALLLAPLCAEYTASDRLENLKLVSRNLELNAVDVDVKGRAAEVVVPKRGKTKESGKKGTKEKVQSKVLLDEIDWVTVSEGRRRQGGRSPEARLATLGSPLQSNVSVEDPAVQSHVKEDGKSVEGYDLILAVDCIYNENLVLPLVHTLAQYCPRGGKTVIWVVVELRSSDVLTLFLDTWMNDDSGPWTILRLGPEAMGDWDGKRPRWVGWVAWR